MQEAMDYSLQIRLEGSDFTSGKEVVNFSVPAGKSVAFRYRMIITSGFHMDDKEINILANDFAARYYREDTNNRIEEEYIKSIGKLFSPCI